MVQVKFYGDLKRFVREPVELEVDSFSELMSGLLTQIKGLREHLKKGCYKVRIGKNTYLEESQVKANIDFKADCTIHFIPVIVGAGKGVGIGQIIVGVVLIAASWHAGGAAGWSYLGAQGFAGATMAFTVGASLIVSGAISLLTPTPSMGDQKIKEGEKNQSTSFSNLKNLTPQGRPIPLLYGRMMTSLVLVSQGAEAYDDAPEADNTQSGGTGKRRKLKRN
ncbi:MAG: tail assembly protein [Haemophilus parainfluenzae]|nr:tail assembly protein [Haemophilus parainfluenzae]MDU4451221.1 tail assembly protein [Haemophilus parainfluenzae]MDU4497689.1 tail assembly protein [Haemophilus parainfluenzae]DAN81364.1 MAG TPA: tail assembly protein [Caudoviricetes sp.]